MNVELLHLLWVVAVFVANMQRETNKDLRYEVKALKERLAKTEAMARNAVDDQHVRAVIEKYHEPMRGDIKEVAAAINHSMREFDEKFHGLALDIARGSRRANHND